MPPIITVHVDLSDDHAWALAQPLKRLGYIHCRSLAADEAQAWLMLQAAEQLRQALAAAGYAPR